MICQAPFFHTVKKKIYRDHLFKQFRNEKTLNIEFCMMHLRIHFIPTNEVAKVLA
ncbi:hypothetical protein MNV_370042 [Candidatus Methanoperedens nitroreducens]|uniref:Uncharacterized protein n=1 Tax=Candidatus Methanoperedens nitratireducens TaxID=1392998 RepID=A0A284VQD1_9EURY|nr:hypothetical protein MNV_370042 [Candidatus Methanoperedens nitroreducens]